MTEMMEIGIEAVMEMILIEGVEMEMVELEMVEMELVMQIGVKMIVRQSQIVVTVVLWHHSKVLSVFHTLYFLDFSQSVQQVGTVTLTTIQIRKVSVGR